MGSILLSIAEREMELRGAVTMEAAFSDKLWEMVDFLQDAGYQISEGENVISYPFDKLTKSKFYRRISSVITGEVNFKTLSELSRDEYVALRVFVDDIDAPLAWDELAAMSERLSCVIYDENVEISAVILCSENDLNIHIDLLGFHEDVNPMYIAEALWAVVTQSMEQWGKTDYKTVTMLPVEKRVISILGNLKKENIMPTKVCGTVYAQKKLTYNGNEYEIEDAMVSDMDMLWHGEVSHIPWQENIGKKLCRI
jgi:hypothetical protein